MTRNEVNDKYFNWMYRLVCGTGAYSTKRQYRKLLACLHSIDFDYSIAMDGNRADDGIDLRYRFGYEHDYDGPIIAKYLDDRPCSVLEMLVALAMRCEEHIMDDPDVGNRTGTWFWEMLMNLGLNIFDDGNFDEDYVVSIIFRFLDRDYGRNGEGGPFTIPNNTHGDLRNVEIWYQMCWYLDKYFVYD